MDYLREARLAIGQVQAKGNVTEDQLDAQLAIACALVAQAELLAALIERLDRLIVPMVGEEWALQTFTYTQEN